jgi:hypothetical protein
MVVFAATFVKIWFGARHRFLLTITILMLTSNFGSILASIFSKLGQERQNIYFIYLQLFSILARDLPFLLAHWIFAFNYWMTSQQMRKLLKGSNLSKQFIKCSNITQVILISLNCLVAVLYSITSGVLSYDDDFQIKHQRRVTIVQYTANYMKGVLLIVSNVFLFDSIRRIR